MDAAGDDMRECSPAMANYDRDDLTRKGSGKKENFKKRNIYKRALLRIVCL